MASLLQTFSAADVATNRAALNTYLFGGSLPSRLVDTIATSQAPYHNLSGGDTDPGSNCARTDKWTINFAGGLFAYGWLYRPTVTPATVGSRLAICHHGHEDNGYGVELVVKAAVDAGLYALEFFMPAVDYGPNTTVHSAATGAQLGSRYLEACIVAINQALNDGIGTQGIGMIGVSGGGWTTTLVAAADTRVRISYPCAGSLPQCLTEGGPTPTSRDVEQVDIADAGLLYGDRFTGPNVGNLSYLDLYVLGACGANRKQVQCLNPGDPFFGNWLWRCYEDEIVSRAALCGGNYSVNVLNPEQNAHFLWAQWKTAFVADMVAVIPQSARRFSGRR